MKLGTLKTKYASLEVSECAALPAHLQGHVREISAVTTKPKHRGKGHGNSLMRMACALADQGGYTLMLHVAPFELDGMDAEQLEAWYKRFGFCVIQQDPKLMARAPNISRVLKSA